MLSQETRGGTAKTKDAAKSAACYPTVSKVVINDLDVGIAELYGMVGLAPS
jgi:MinD-like ATPase involved in chromosome partitioning or flagellar assembly